MYCCLVIICRWSVSSSYSTLDPPPPFPAYVQCFISVYHMPFYLFPYFYSLLAAGDLLDHTDVRHNDIVAGGLLQMNVWNVWKTLVEAAATNDVDYVSTEVLQQSLLDFHVIWCCLIIYNINWNKYYLWHIWAILIITGSPKFKVCCFVISLLFNWK